MSRSVKRSGVAAVLLVAVASLALAVPTLRSALTDIGAMSAWWIAAGVALELVSCLSFVVLFRAFFETVPARTARRVAWSEMGSGALLPGGGLSGYAVGGILLHAAGLDRRQIVVRSGGLFWFTTGINALAILCGSLLLALGASAGPADFLHAGLPFAGTLLVAAAVIAAALLARRGRRRWLVELGEGVTDATRALAHPSWRLIGAIGYLGFDIAVLWATFEALGYAPPIAVLMLGYLVGYLGTLIPVPGGLGVLEGGIAGVLIAYGTPAAETLAATLVYHAIALWIPSLGGLVFSRGAARSVLTGTATASPPAPAAPVALGRPAREMA